MVNAFFIYQPIKMKRLLLLSAIAVASYGTITAQQKRIQQTAQQRKGEFSVNMGYNFGLQKGAGGTLYLQPEYGKNFTDMFYFGAGTGIAADDGFNTFSIPAFVRAEIDFQAGKVTPYISLQGGYDFLVSGGSGTGAGRISPTTGIKVPISQNTTFKLGFGYTRTIISGGGGDYLGFNAGVGFNAGGHGIANFFKKFEYSVELETMLPVSGPVRNYGGDKSQYKYSDFIGFRFNGIMPTGLENLYAGYSIGIGRCTEKWHWEGKYDTNSQNTGTGFLSVMARAKYKAKQLNITDRIYPFAQVDMGLAACYDFAFTVNPAVGISIITGNDHSIDISAGYYTVSCDDDINGDSNKGTLRIAAGYTF